jgi:hypothetical protein
MYKKYIVNSNNSVPFPTTVNFPDKNHFHLLHICNSKDFTFHYSFATTHELKDLSYGLQPLLNAQAGPFRSLTEEQLKPKLNHSDCSLKNRHARQNLEEAADQQSVITHLNPEAVL